MFFLIDFNLTENWFREKRIGNKWVENKLRKNKKKKKSMRLSIIWIECTSHFLV